MLTRKQRLRKLKAPSKARNFELPSEELLRLMPTSAVRSGLCDLDVRYSRSHSWPSGEARSFTNSVPKATPRQEGRRVTFGPTVNVLLVPSRRDFDNDVSAALWWSHQDTYAFRQRAFEFYKRHGSLTVQEGEGEEVAPAAAASPRAAAATATAALPIPKAAASSTSCADCETCRVSGDAPLSSACVRTAAAVVAERPKQLSSSASSCRGAADLCAAEDSRGPSLFADCAAAAAAPLLAAG